MFSSLRLRLTLWYVAILAVILLAVGAMVYVLVARSLDSQINDSLSQVSQRAAATASLGARPLEGGASSGVRRDDEDGHEGRGEHQRDADFTGLIGGEAFGGAAGVFVLAVDANGNIVANPNNVPTDGLPDLNALAVAGRQGKDRRDVTAGGSHLRLLTVAVGGGDEHGAAGFIVTGRSLAQRDGDLRRLLVLLVIGGGAGLVMAGLGGLWVGELAIRPIRSAFARQRDFVADASHELRTPIAVIRANAESLQGRVSPDDTEALQDIVDESEHVSRLISRLLTLAQADKAGIELRPEPVDLHDVVSYAARAARQLAEGSQLTIDGHPEHLIVRGDLYRLRELAMILVDNAIKYTDPGGIVAISAARAGDQALLSVQDNGVGIAPEHLPRVFDRFYRVDKARSRAQGGFGLGLSIAQAIVQAHGGRIDIASEAGAGTTVRVLLPLEPSAARVAPPLTAN